MWAPVGADLRIGSQNAGGAGCEKSELALGRFSKSVQRLSRLHLTLV